MDTTPKYIKMCEKSPLRGTWEPTYGDYIAGEWYIDQEDTTGLVPLGIVLKYNNKKQLIDAGGDIQWYKELIIPLYRQDQLQEMVSDRLLGLQTVCAVLHDFSITEGEGLQFTMNDGSMEQLWLAYVMHEKYGKIWDDKKEEWVHL